MCPFMNESLIVLFIFAIKKEKKCNSFLQIVVPTQQTYSKIFLLKPRAKQTISWCLTCFFPCFVLSWEFSNHMWLSFKLQVKARQLEHAKSELGRDLEQLKDQLDQQREHRQEQERRVGAHTRRDHVEPHSDTFQIQNLYLQYIYLCLYYYLYTNIYYCVETLMFKQNFKFSVDILLIFLMTLFPSKILIDYLVNAQFVSNKIDL